MVRNRHARFAGLLVLSLFAVGQVVAQPQEQTDVADLVRTIQALNARLSALANMNLPIEELKQSLRPGYSLTCKDFAEEGWQSRYQCLTDGRIHLIYYHDKDGRPGKWNGIPFSHQDFALLMQAVKEGAQVWAGEGDVGHRLLCVDVGTSGNWDKGPIVCSSAPRIYADWGKAKHGATRDGEWSRYFSDGHREYQLLPVETGSTPVSTYPQAYRWYIRY